MVSIVEARSEEQMKVVKTLFTEYSESIGIDLNFQGFADELHDLPGVYSPPKGCILLASENCAPVGCVALKPISDNICEMKRLYVRKSHQGRGIGRMLVKDLIRTANRKNYHRMRLDTIPTMQRAIKLYESFGFYKIPEYRYNPLEGALFFEILLD